MLPPIAVIFPAAGKSSRFGGKEKKPFLNLDGRAVWLRSAELFVTRPEVKQSLVVISPDDLEMFKTRYGANLGFLNIQIVLGGAERFESVANALEKLNPEIELVAIHDAVRPATPAPLIDALFQAAAQHGAAIPGIPISDTIKQVDNALKVQQTIPRSGLWLVQTPQVFRKDWLLEAYAKRKELQEAITDDSQLIESLGHPVQMVLGSPQNIKITSREDLILAEMFIKNRQSEAPKPRGPFDDDWMR